MSNIIILNNNTPSVQYLCSKDKRLAKVISMVGSIQYSPYIDNAYSFLIHEIIEQMLSIKAGQKIYERLIELCDGQIIPEKINTLSDKDIRSTGTSTAKVTYIRNITKAYQDGRINLNALRELSDEEIIIKLTDIRGVGNWTAKMFLIFVLNRPDVLPYEDSAFIQAYSWAYKTTDLDKASIEKKCRKWKPYRSIASRYLYKALDAGLTKSEFHLYK